MKVQNCFSIILTLLFIFNLATPGAIAQTATTPQVSLFAKTGIGDYYTIYTTGLKKEDSYIGGFKSVQLDPQSENIYFYDTVLKVIARINILDGKIYNVIGKPKSNTTLNYSTPVKFADASLGSLNDFIFDKYGNIYILIHNNPGDPASNISPSSPRLLKASLKDGIIKEILNFETQFKPGITGDYTFSINLTNLSYDQNKYIYAYGKSTFPSVDGYFQVNGQNSYSTIYRYDPLFSTSELFGGNVGLKSFGFNLKYIFNPTNSPYPSLKSLAFDYNGTCYVGISDYINSAWTTVIKKLVPSSNNDGTFTETVFAGDGTGSTSDIGDGGLATGAYAGISSPLSFCNDKSGDIYFADSSTNRIRKILNNNGLITTAAGGGTETLTAYGQFKSPRLISLQSPASILIDKYNNTYIADNNRILAATNFITYGQKLSEQVKIANLAITKIAGSTINDPKGNVSLPDLKLDYTFAGDQTVEVKGSNIPDGTNIKLLSINTDGTIISTNSTGKLTGGWANIPVKIDAGTTKVIKAETDPFIPAPGVYLQNTAPQLAAGQLPTEPVTTAPKREEINFLTKDSSGMITNENLIAGSGRFAFSPLFGWRHGYFYDYANTQVLNNVAADPDNNVQDASLITFGPTNDSIYLANVGPATGTTTFTVWMRTDSENITVPIGIGPSCSVSGWTGCGSAAAFAGGNPTNYSYTNAAVTNTWQKFSITSNANQDSQSKTLIIGGPQTINKKIYVWGARLEKVQ